MQITTIRESLDTYKRRMAKEGFSGEEDYRYYPRDNHLLAIQAGSDDIRRMFEESGQFKFKLANKRNGVNLYSMTCLPTKTLIIADCVDKGGPDRGCYLESKKLLGCWTPISIHPEGYGADNCKGTINTLEIILEIAEKHRVKMVTDHKDGFREHSVSYFPK